MLNRRQMLSRTVQGASLVALGPTVPGFLASSARAAAPGKDKVLVVLELAGGNDGLNTVIPYADDLYHKARPTLRIEKKDVVRVDDAIGLHPALRPLDKLLENGQLAIVQGVGYPNPDRSHFESMDIWQSADPRRRTINGWLGRALGGLKVSEGAVPAFYVGTERLPLAMQGPSAGVASLHPAKPLDVQLSGAPREEDGRNSGAPPTSVTRGESSKADPDAARRKLIRELTSGADADATDALQFVRRTSLQTLTTIDRLREIMGNFARPDGEYQLRGGEFTIVRQGLQYELQLVAAMIRAGIGARIYYVSLAGFDTHGSQATEHRQLLDTLAKAVRFFFQTLEESGDASRVLLTTFSEFGRRVEENGSEGTDHGSGSCMLVAGPGVKSGLVGKHPSLRPADLADGDLKFHTDFRQVYATLLDSWLEVDSRRVLDGKFEHVAMLKKSS
jgi:uncharacterized protein (DUF1501 family)